MKIKKMYNAVSTKYIAIIRKLLLIVTILLFAFLFISQIAFPDERDTLSTDCQVFEAQWQQVLENGDRIDVEIPGKVPAEYGEVVTLTTTLPEDMYHGEYLCFQPVWQDVEILIDGELRQSYTTKESRPFGINSPMRYLFVELGEEDAGKELAYQFSSYSKYAGNMRTSYIGDRLSIWVHLLEKSGLQSVIAIFLLLLSLFCIITCMVLKLAYKKPLALSYLAWTVFFCACWMLSEAEYRQILVKNISILSCYAYWSLMIIPLPLSIYMNEIQNGRYQKFFFVPITYSVFILIVGTLLQIFDIVQFVQQIPYIHFGIIVALLCIVGTIVADVIRKKISDYLFVGIGIFGLLLTAVLEMVVYYMGSNLSLGTVLAIGLVFLLVMAIIKTGQDLFESEKKKQQAILAREAQAKFLANMSHEIRTPINAIIGMNEMILRENEDAGVREYSHSIQNASNMLLGLVNDVLDFSKIESGQLELVEETYDLASLLRDEMLLLRARAAEKPISTQIEADARIPAGLWGDELRIKQVLTNLLSNAVKYTKEGTVTLKVSYKQVDPDTIVLYFSVTDTGIGIKEENLEQVFDSFKRLELDKNRAIQGTGLGLNIAKQLVTLMRGTISVESEYGKGSVFTVVIPQKIMDKKPIGELEISKPQVKKSKQVTKNYFTAPEAKILVVDDNSMNLAVIKGLLKRTRMQLDFANSGKDGLELTKNKKYDIILMDHMMPELDGVEVLHMLRADKKNSNQNTIVIALTANAVAGSREMYAEYGFDDYFTKPILADKLDELLLLHLPKELVHMTIEGEETVTEEKIMKEEKTTIDKAPETGEAAAANVEVSEELLVIDHELGLSYCMDSEEFYEEILIEFDRQCSEYLPQLETHFQNRDWKNYAILAHALKGSSLNIGAANFSQLSLKHELAGKEENVSFIEAEYAGYVAAVKALVKKIKK